MSINLVMVINMDDKEIDGRLRRLEQRMSIMEGLQVSTLRRVADEIEGNTKPTSPPEMPEHPEIEPYKVGRGPDGAMVLTGTCIRWGNVVGKKPAKSCNGCTVGCPGKGKQEPEKEQPDGPPVYGDDTNPGRAPRGDWPKES
jgi:hypothetical protein